MKKILYALLLTILMVTLVGCAKIVNTETRAVKATIIDIDRDPPRNIGKTHRAADYDIFLKYEDIETWIDISRTEYNKYKDMVGATIDANLIVDYYDDDSTVQYLRLPEETQKAKEKGNVVDDVIFFVIIAALLGFVLFFIIKKWKN